MVPVLFLVGVGPFARWKEASIAELARALRWAFVAAVIVAIVMPLFYGSWKPLTALGLLLAAWIVFAGTLNFIEAGAGNACRWLLPHRHDAPATPLLRDAYGARRCRRLRRRGHDGLHLPGGKDVKMAPGDTVAVAGLSSASTACGG